MIRITTHSEMETVGLGKRLGNLLEAGDIILLRGGLGTGKTAFTRGVAAGLGIDGAITSPTFTLMHQYEGRFPLYHFDIYRLQEPEEILDLDFEEYFYGNGIAVVEWPERMEGYIPSEYIGITINRAQNPDERVIDMEFIGDRYKTKEGELKGIEDIGN